MNIKDKILKTMISNENLKSKGLIFFTPRSLQEFAFTDLNVDQVEHLIKEIINEKPELIKNVDIPLQKGIAILPTGIVESFLKKGGFTKEEELKKEIQNKQQIKEGIDLEKSLIELKLKKWQLRTFWWIFGIAIIGSGLSIYNFIENLKYQDRIEKTSEKAGLEKERINTVQLNEN